MQTKAKTVGYWVATGVLAALFLASGAAELASAPAVALAMHALGYPLYILTILGLWKILGAAALLYPRLPRLKEWAYAGVFFDLTGAAISPRSLRRSPSKNSDSADSPSHRDGVMGSSPTIAHLEVGIGASEYRASSRLVRG